MPPRRWRWQQSDGTHLTSASMPGPYPVNAPLNALRAFEAVARNRSFLLAARELGVTPSAVGQLVARLEKDFGVDLFARPRTGPGGLSLTPPAADALPHLQAAFASLSLAVRHMQGGSGPVRSRPSPKATGGGLPD